MTLHPFGCNLCFMDIESLRKKLAEAEVDLAFALAQGDGYAEDAAAARITDLKRKIAEAE